MAKVYYVYIVKCSDNSYYIGLTNNIQDRIWQHNFGHASKSYTFYRRPVILVFCEAFLDINQAIAFEKQIKGWTVKKKEVLIKREWEKLKELAKCTNISHYLNKPTDKK